MGKNNRKRQQRRKGDVHRRPDGDMERHRCEVTGCRQPSVYAVGGYTWHPSGWWTGWMVCCAAHRSTAGAAFSQAIWAPVDRLGELLQVLDAFAASVIDGEVPGGRKATGS